jgi:hypothetical protein
MNDQQQVKAKVDTSQWQVYTNTRSGYSIKYPSATEITQLTGFGISEPITPTAQHVGFRQNNKDFYLSIYETGLQTLTEQSIQQSFGSISAEQIHVTPVHIENLSGYKSAVDAQGVTSDFYYFENEAEIIIGVSVPKNSDIGLIMLSTLMVQ